MKTTYSKLKYESDPVLEECFFAFSNQQFEEGIKKAGIEGQKIYRGVGGLYGTMAGIEKLMNFYDNIDKEIAEKCDPQEVYDYEFSNHECSYTNDDSEVIDIVVNCFGIERAKEVKRRNAHKKHDNGKN